MLPFTLKAIGAKKLDLAFTGLAGQIKDWRKLWPAVVNQMVKTEARQFATEGALGGHGRWADYKRDDKGISRYETAKRKKWGEKPMMQASERLRDSLAEKTGDTIEELEPLKMRFGSSVPYAIFQQTGTRKMPARRLIDFTAEDQAVVQKEIQRQAINFSRRLGFAVAAKAGFRDVTAGEARRRGGAALSGGPGAELAGNF